MRAKRALASLWLGLHLAAPLSSQTLDDAVDLHLEGRLREALAAYRAVAARVERTEPSEAATARNNACTILNELGDFRAALAECEAALRLRNPRDEPNPAARTLNNAGLSLHYLGDYGAAERRFREALELNRVSGDAEGQVINLSNLAMVATSQGRYNRALALQESAAGLASRHLEEPWATGQALVARINQGVILEKLGSYREALDVYRDVGRQGDRLDPRSRASLDVNTGVVYRNLGDPVSAQEAFREAIRIYEAEGDRAGLSNAWLNTALVHHLNLRQPRAAEEAYRKALAYARESGDRSEEIQDLFYLGLLLLEQRRLGEAEQAFSRSLQAAEASGSAEGRWSALEGLGRVAVARGDRGRAVQLLERAMAEIETVRSTLRRSALRSRFFGEKRPVYAAAVDLLAASGQAERALDVVQRAKVRDLLDALGGSGQAAHPLGFAALQERIGDGLLLEYFLGEKNLYLWVVDGDGVRMSNLGPHGPILADVLAVHDALARRQEPDAARLARLARVLLGSIDEIGVDELRIAPDHALRYLPFELLGDPPVLERAAVSYLPSGSALGWLRQPDGEPGLTLLGFGDPEISGASAAAETAARYRLPPLPGAATELRTLSGLLPGQHALHTGSGATESTFRQAVSSGARVVHLATHTVIDERPGRGAAILFAAAGEDDGLLYPEEIAAMEYHASLSVLAGCRTALAPGGSGSQGDALTTLTGSFLAAGSPAVLATLWEVGDDATAVFMEQLYHELGQGRRPADALRRTKLRLRKDPRWSRPGLWSGYVLIGESPRVAAAPHRRYLLGALALALLALAPPLLARRRRLRGTVLEEQGP